jgi:hypothetical protein
MTEESTVKKTRMPRAVKSGLVILIVAAVAYFFMLPPLNLHSLRLFRYLLALILVYLLVNVLFALKDGTYDKEKARFSGIFILYLHNAKKHCKPTTRILGALVLIFVVGWVISFPLFRSGAYHQLLTVSTGDFSTEVEQLPYSEIPMLDASSTVILGDRKLGELSDMVSQFEVSEDYTQINLQNRPVRVASLEYGDVFKWFFNQKEGLPAYVSVDMVSQEVQVVRLSDLGMSGIRYSPAEYLARDLDRVLRFRYPTYMFTEPHLEIDEDGAPWWVCPRETRTIGLFGGADVIGVVMLNACTGESQYYDLEDVPTWVDQVFNAELVSQQYDYYGKYVQGFLNSIIGQKEVTVTTSGTNYLAMNDDVYMYTGVTSVSSDQSNIGFLLCNQRTKEAVYYSAPGAIETSAQKSAEGVVQDLGYTATFPLLLNIGGEPTYFMSLKDSSELVKMYAMVCVEQYQLVATGNTVTECEENYLALMQKNGLSVSSTPDLSTAEDKLTGTVAEIRSAVKDGTTYYYIRLEGEDGFYSFPATQDDIVVLLDPGDEITFRASESEAGRSVTAGSDIALAQ